MNSFDLNKVCDEIHNIETYVIFSPELQAVHHEVLDWAIGNLRDQAALLAIYLKENGGIPAEGIPYEQFIARVAPNEAPVGKTKKAKSGWLVTFDFSKRPLSTFYSLLDALAGAGGIVYQQKSVYLCKDAETAQDLVALCRYYGAGTINAVSVVESPLDQAADRHAAEARIAALHSERLRRRGRKPTVKRRVKK